MGKCPNCDVADILCWDDTTIRWRNVDGAPDGVQRATSMVCPDCGYHWIRLDPSSEVMGRNHCYPDITDWLSVFR